MHIDWEHLQSFLRTVEAGSLSAAARQLGSSQPTIGRHIDILERSLEVRLFDRMSTGLQLTDAGTRLVEHARKMGEAADNLTRIAAGSVEKIAGPVRITASEIVANYVLPPLLVRLTRQYPEIEFEVVASDDSPSLLSREVDIALRMYRPTQLDLIVRKIGDLPLGAFAHTDYLDEYGRPQSAQDCKHHRMIGDDRETLLIDGAREIGIELDRGDFAIRSDSFVVQWNAIRAGLGIGFCQVSLGESDPNLERILPDLNIPALPVWLASHRDLRTNRRIRLVYDYLGDVFAKN